MTLDLQRFCADEFPARMVKPFSYGKHTYATDGHILIRVPRRGNVSERQDAPLQGDVLSLFTPMGMDGVWTAFPEIKLPAPGPCKWCDGSGEDQGIHSVKGVPCLECDGSGFGKPTGIYRFKTFDLDIKYAALISEMDESEICVPHVEFEISPVGKKSEHTILWRFKGGDGVVMPMRRNVTDEIEVGLRELEAA